MAVHYVNGGGGLLGSLGQALGAASMFVPGMQAYAPWIGAASSLANGNVGGAVGNAASGVINNGLHRNMDKFDTRMSNRESLWSALRSAHEGRGSGYPAWNSDPVTGEINHFKRYWGAR